MTVSNKQIHATGKRISCSPDIAIRVKNGTAVISGTACTIEEVVQAENAVNLMSGIDRVFNMVKTSSD